MFGSVLAKISEVVMANVEPTFKKVAIAVNSGYGCGGWKDLKVAEAFHTKIANAFAVHGWIVSEGKPGKCAVARRYGQYLYLHPSTIEGMIREENFGEVKKILLSCDAVSFDSGEPVIRTFGNIYAVSDGVLGEIFAARQTELMALLLEAAGEKGGLTENKVFEYLANSKIMRGEDTLYGFSVNSLEYILTMQAVAALVALGLLSKTAGMLNTTYKPTAAGKRWLKSQKTTETVAA